jgi:hypothetical protein
MTAMNLGVTGQRQTIDVISCSFNPMQLSLHFLVIYINNANVKSHYHDDKRALKAFVLSTYITKGISTSTSEETLTKQKQETLLRIRISVLYCAGDRGTYQRKK